MKARLKRIKLLIMDVDGVMTDGKIIMDSEGKETKFFDVQDGYGIVLAQRQGLLTAILSARASGVVKHRAKDLGIEHVYVDAYPKIKAYDELIQKLRIKDEEVCFIGDDLPDVEVLARVGFAVSVPNGTTEARQQADYVTCQRGGQGAIREVVEMILKAQNRWPFTSMGMRKP